jgi:hypothetical protein
MTKNDDGVFTPEQQANRERIRQIIASDRVNEAQRREIERVLEQPNLLKTRAQRGSFMEMLGDAIMEKDGFDRLGPESNRIVSIDQKGHNGIDGIYFKAGDKPEYRVVDQKYSTSGSFSLGNTKSGRQLSPQWIEKRLEAYFTGSDKKVSAADQAYLDTLRAHYQEQVKKLTPDEDETASDETASNETASADVTSQPDAAQQPDITVSEHVQVADGNWRMADVLIETVEGDPRAVSRGERNDIS